MTNSYTFNGLLIFLSVILALILLLPKISNNETWKATLTPLSSIVGSGFLIMAPLLASIVAELSVYTVMGIALAAYGIGHVIRFNITHLEPRIKNGTLHPRAREIEYLANLALVIAYIIAVAFYLSLLSSFLMTFLGINNDVLEKSITSAVIIIIAVTGYVKGLSGLEKMEAYSMTAQLAIVFSLLVALAVYAIDFVSTERSLSFTITQRDTFTKIQMIAGGLLVVQGFETSRFIGEHYSAETRIKSMRNAQLFSGALYIVSVLLFLPIVQHMDLQHVELADIIEVSGLAALALPTMLMIAALMSQFSAAVADTGGAGGLLNENSNKRLSTNLAYLGVAVCSVLLVWAADLLNIITLASRAFATYYLLQTLLAIIYCYTDCPKDKPVSLLNRGVFFVIAAMLLFVVIFAIPAE